MLLSAAIGVGCVATVNTMDKWVQSRLEQFRAEAVVDQGGEGEGEGEGEVENEGQGEDVAPE